MLFTPFFKLAPEDSGGRVSVPGFTKTVPGGASEDEADEIEILTDQDLTEKLGTEDDENMGAKSESLDVLEEEPEPFLEGEIDVKEQMDRAADAMDSSIRGLQNQGYEDSPRSELGAAFRNTPGGIEEVEMKTDQDLALHRHPPRAHKHPSRRHSGHRGEKR
jgi:hypothetical protein